MSYSPGLAAVRRPAASPTRLGWAPCTPQPIQYILRGGYTRPQPEPCSPRTCSSTTGHAAAHLLLPLSCLLAAAGPAALHRLRAGGCFERLNSREGARPLRAREAERPIVRVLIQLLFEGIEGARLLRDCARDYARGAYRLGSPFSLDAGSRALAPDSLSCRLRRQRTA